MADHLEIEQKFDVDPDFERPDFGGLRARLRAAAGPETETEEVSVAAPVRHQLSATYFDTHDGRLAARQVTLRRRTGGPDEGWHLKLPATALPASPAHPASPVLPASAALPASPVLPAGVSARREVHAPLSAGSREVPERLAARVAEVTDGLPLTPIATLDTERTVVTVTGRDGRVLAEIADDLVTARRLSPGSEPLRWREIEVEVPAPAPGLQQAAADLLFAAGARPAGHGSKLAKLMNR